MKKIMKCEKKRMLLTIIVAFVIFIIMGFLPSIILGLPIKYAIKKEDIIKYENSILIKQTWTTGTGWEKIGDQFGFLQNTEKYDVILTADIPPSIGIGGNHVNTFLCIVEYLGIEYEPNYGGEFEKYLVIEWYPLYPVLRDTILPSWLYPKGYMTKTDIK